jgi:bud emergence protein 1
MKTFRKSLHRETQRLQISTPLPQISKPASASLPPQKVIRAIAPHSPNTPQELPFQKGDFFYVTADPATDSPWYEAHNPVTGARGLVPKILFEEFLKSPSVSVPPPRPPAVSPPNSRPSPSSPVHPPKSQKTRVFYAVVLHDFLAERADELDAKAGDPISVVAQSNREWFVAKPIGRLGRPGLIPASFVELRDPASNLPIDDVDALMDRGDLPKVEDWKKAMINYKQNSISLGVIDDSQPSVPNSPYTQLGPAPLPTQPTQPTPPPRPASPVPLPDGILLSAEVVSFHHEMDEYWFRIDAIFQPYDPLDPHVLPKAKQLVLFRPYNDFYDFQVNLLETFPQEAGREPGSNRILPFMPGPAEKVDDEVTAVRRLELDQYIRKLCDLNSVGASYVLEHQLIRTFLALKPGDVENNIEPRYEEISALFSDGGELTPAGVAHGDLVTREFEQEVRDTLGEMKLSDRDERSDGSDYGEEHTPPSHSYSRATGAAHQRSDTQTLVRQADALPHQSGEPSAPHGERSNGHTNALRASRGSAISNSQWPEYATSSPSSLHSSQPSVASRSRSHSTATTTLNAPRMSAGNPQIAFVKIKIFDRVTDDLIAIRVHPKVTHSELMTKVQARLGTSISNLRYRDSLHHEFIGLEGDYDLRGWLESAEKHVLYAD